MPTVSIRSINTSIGIEEPQKPTSPTKQMKAARSATRQFTPNPLTPLMKYSNPLLSQPNSPALLAEKLRTPNSKKPESPELGLS
jgi:hypothetical protein